MNKHTPGPWVVDGEDDIVPDVPCILIVCEGKRVCDVSSTLKDDGEFVLTDQDRANAHLIAAAPDLLEALEWTMRFVEQVRAESPLPAGSGEDISYKEARAALAKAYGGQSDA